MSPRALSPWVLVLALLLATLALPAAAQERKLPLVDEGASDVSWLRFKKRVSDAIASRDKQFLLSILDRNDR